MRSLILAVFCLSSASYAAQPNIGPAAIQALFVNTTELLNSAKDAFLKINNLTLCSKKIAYAKNWTKHEITDPDLRAAVDKFVNLTCVLDGFYQKRFLPQVRKLNITEAQVKKMRADYYNLLVEGANDPNQAIFDFFKTLNQTLVEMGVAKPGPAIANALLATTKSMSQNYIQQIKEAFVDLRSMYSNATFDPVTYVAQLMGIPSIPGFGKK